MGDTAQKMFATPAVRRRIVEDMKKHMDRLCDSIITDPSETVTKLLILKLSLVNPIKFCKKVGAEASADVEEQDADMDEEEDEAEDESENKKAKTSGGKRSAAVMCLQLPSVRKYALQKLLEAYCSVLPTERIRLPTEKEQNQRMQKATRESQQHEVSLLNQYRGFLGILERYLRAAFGGGPKGKRVQHDELQSTAAAHLGLVSLRGLCTLLERAPQFNFANNLLVLLVPLSNHRQRTVATLVCDTLGRVLRATSTGGRTGAKTGSGAGIDADCAVQLVRLLTRFIQKRRFRVRASVLRIALQLELDEDAAQRVSALTQEDAAAAASRRKRDKRGNGKGALSRNERKQQKEISRLEKTLEGDSLVEIQKSQIKMTTQLVQSIFLLLFKVLKMFTSGSASAKEQSNGIKQLAVIATELKDLPIDVEPTNAHWHPKTSKRWLQLFSVALDGFYKFFALLSYDYFDALMNSLADALQSAALGYLESVKCVKLILTIHIAQQGVVSTLTEPYRFYATLFRLLSQLPTFLHATSSASKRTEAIRRVTECCRLVIGSAIERRGALGESMRLSFAKRIVTVLMHSDASSLSRDDVSLLVECVRRCALPFPAPTWTQNMLSNDGRVDALNVQAQRGALQLPATSCGSAKITELSEEVPNYDALYELHSLRIHADASHREAAAFLANVHVRTRAENGKNTSPPDGQRSTARNTQSLEPDEPTLTKVEDLLGKLQEIEAFFDKTGTKMPRARR